MPFLEALVDAGHDLRVVVTNKDKRRGRGAALVPSAVKAAADARGLRVTADVDDVLTADVERGVVVAFGRLLKPHVLERVPMVNVHFSLLPRWRGAAPVERAILAGDPETGVCLMELEEGLDTGPVYACAEVAINGDESLDALRQRLVAAGVPLLIEHLGRGLGVATPQDGEPTYAAKIDPEELHLDWTRPAVEVHRVIRLGRAWTTFRGKRLRVLRASLVNGPNTGRGVLVGTVVGAGDGEALELLEVQPEGRAPQSAEAWRNGARPADGERLGS